MAFAEDRTEVIQESFETKLIDLIYKKTRKTNYLNETYKYFKFIFKTALINNLDTFRISCQFNKFDILSEEKFREYYTRKSENMTRSLSEYMKKEYVENWGLTLLEILGLMEELHFEIVGIYESFFHNAKFVFEETKVKIKILFQEKIDFLENFIGSPLNYNDKILLSTDLMELIETERKNRI